MAYTRINWDETTTPLSPDNLNTMDKGIDDLDTISHARKHNIDDGDDHGDMTADRIVGRASTSGAPQQLDAAAVKTMLSLNNVDNFKQARSAAGYDIQKNGSDGTGIINFKTS